MLQEYVLGFMFSLDRSKVALIKKTKPTWQAGKLNGIGGKVEPYDPSVISAMRREFQEETGVHYEDWKRFATMRGNGWHVHCFFAASNLIDNCKTTTEEEVFVLPVDLALSGSADTLIYNLQFIIPMALQEEVSFAEITYNVDKNNQ